MDNVKLNWADWLERKQADYRTTGNLPELQACRDALEFAFEWGVRNGLPKVSDRLDLQATYVAMRIDGTSHNLAEMFTLRTPPMSNSDREFLEGRGGCYDQFGKDPLAGEFYRRAAKAQGVDTTGKIYEYGLARFPGDGEAWISDRHELKKRVEERGWSCNGAVNVKAREFEPTPDVAVAEDIVDQAVVNRIEADPALAFRDARNVREETKEMITPHWAK